METTNRFDFFAPTRVWTAHRIGVLAALLIGLLALLDLGLTGSSACAGSAGAAALLLALLVAAAQVLSAAELPDWICSWTISITGSPWQAMAGLGEAALP